MKVEDRQRQEPELYDQRYEQPFENIGDCAPAAANTELREIRRFLNAG